jgi:hypothetical protein
MAKLRNALQLPPVPETYNPLQWRNIIRALLNWAKELTALVNGNLDFPENLATDPFTITAGSGISVSGQTVTNADKGTTARTAHEAAYNHSTLSSIVSLSMGLDADKPATGFTGQRFYFATDTAIMYVDTGAAWQAVKGTPVTIGEL